VQTRNGLLTWIKKDYVKKHLLLSKTATWIPDWGMSRIYSMVKKRPDWCISRQRYVGVPITLFIHKETDELHPKALS